MLHKITANQPSFHAVTFTPGLNVILAERSDTSTVKDTRNGVGKSTLIDIINFCLGSRAVKGKGLLIEPLAAWSFTLELTLCGHLIQATRSVKSPGLVFVEGQTATLPRQPHEHKETKQPCYKVEDWKALLGECLFALKKSAALKYNLSFRSLISYFCRAGSGAYHDPFRHFPQQRGWDVQMNVAFLLGMNWELVSRWQELLEQEDGLKNFDKAVKAGALDSFGGSVGEMETHSIQLEQQVQSSADALASFQVHPRYEELEREASQLTLAIHELSNENVVDRNRLERYNQSMDEEQPPASLSLEKLYEASGLIFSDAVKKSLDEARSFHQQIVVNRKEFLTTELKALQAAIRDRQVEIQRLSGQRASCLAVLKTHGALAEYSKLQDLHTLLKADLDRLKAKIHDVKELNVKMRALKAEKTRLVALAEQDHEQRRGIWARPVMYFNECSQALYHAAGKLVIDVAGTLYKFSVDIERGGSEGIGKMKVFCFDLALLRASQHRFGIDFLIHDTTIFDAVDTRQRARALELAHQVTLDQGAQYICALNSDMVPIDDFSPEFRFEDHVRLTLSDARPEERLLGVGFERGK